MSLQLADPAPPARGTEGSGRLRDGTLVYVRRARPTDLGIVVDFVRRVSPESIEQRYFSAVRPESIGSEILELRDGVNRLSLLEYVELPDRCELIGHGEYIRDGPRAPMAEVAFLVADAYHHQGAATLLLDRLARAARDQGVHQFRAIVLPENLDMLFVFRNSGFPYAEEHRRDCVNVTLSIQDEPHRAFGTREMSEELTKTADAVPAPGSGTS